MVSIKPRSILQLTITGFLSVTGLLFIALLITARQLDGLGDRNVNLMNESAMALDLGRTLIELTTALERNARQYNVLGDEDILQLYEERQLAFIAAANRLNLLQLNEEIQELLSDAEALEQQAYQSFAEANASDIESMYAEILRVANRIATQINEWSNAQIIEIADETEATQQLLTLQAFILVVAALLLAALFTALITRPLLQLEKAVGRLGAGGYEDTIEVSGPRDLVNLGQKLDWLRSRLHALEQQRSSFIRHVSHELKTPLAAIRESASLLDDGVVGELNDKQKNVVDIQLNNSKRLQQLIDELLRHHLASFSVINTMPEPVKLDELIEKELVSHDVTIRSARIEIHKSLVPVTVHANPEQLRVVIDNLLSNAIKYSPQGSAIDIMLDLTESEAVIEICDDGPGIPVDEVEHIFDAFYQGRPPDKDYYQGSGLGLAIAQEYVEANNGQIRLVRSRSGACFRITLPIGDDTSNE